MLWNICIQNSLRITSYASVRCWTMDIFYGFKCKRLRNTRHTATFGKLFLKHPVYLRHTPPRQGGELSASRLCSYTPLPPGTALVTQCIGGRVWSRRLSLASAGNRIRNPCWNWCCHTSGHGIWDLMLFYNPVKVKPCFGGMYRLHLQKSKISEDMSSSGLLQPWTVLPMLLGVLSQLLTCGQTQGIWTFFFINSLLAIRIT
jgi:hypothetical protein